MITMQQLDQNSILYNRAIHFITKPRFKEHYKGVGFVVKLESRVG